MKAIAFNGSPRNNGTTATLLKKTLEGAASVKAETEFIQLSTLKMRGCQACFACKIRNGKSYGKCALSDEFTAIYKKLELADAIFLGSPIYFGAISSYMKMFIERLYPYLNYGTFVTNFPKKISVGFIYTMGAEEEHVHMFKSHIETNAWMLKFALGSTVESLLSIDTLLVEDQSKIVADKLAPFVPRKQKHKQEIFPQDCQKAFEMGARLVQNLPVAADSNPKPVEKPPML